MLSTTTVNPRFPAEVTDDEGDYLTFQAIARNDMRTDEIEALGRYAEQLGNDNARLSREKSELTGSVHDLTRQVAKLAAELAAMRLDAAYQRAQECAEKLAAELSHSDDTLDRGAVDPLSPTQLLAERGL
jgi:predicted RNase H-like nuclease (RuvC/YqgF family)